MNRRTVRVVAVAVLAVAAIGFGAATLTSTTGGDGGGGGGGDAALRDVVNRTPGMQAPPPNRTTSEGGGLDTNIPGGCITFLQSPLFIWGSVGVIGASLLYLRRRHGTSGAAFVLVTAFLPLLLVLYAVFASCGDISLANAGVPSANLSRVARDLGGGTVGAPASPPPVVIGIVVAAVVVLAGVLVRQSRGGTATDVPEDGGEEDEGGLAALGEAAGAAADRIEAQADVDNEVYRAWQEMAELVGADRPETSTPGEFAAAAVEAGMDPGDVEELTRLFEEVRYGDEPPTEERERRAVAAMRNVEETYSEPTADPDYDADNRGGER